MNASPIPHSPHPIHPVLNQLPGTGSNAIVEPPAVQWRTKAQIAEHFNCHIRTITKYMKRRILPFVKVGRWVRMDLAACDRAMKKFERQSKVLE